MNALFRRFRKDEDHSESEQESPAEQVSSPPITPIKESCHQDSERVKEAPRSSESSDQTTKPNQAFKPVTVQTTESKQVFKPTAVGMDNEAQFHRPTRPTQHKHAKPPVDTTAEPQSPQRKPIRQPFKPVKKQEKYEEKPREEPQVKPRVKFEEKPREEPQVKPRVVSRLKGRENQFQEKVQNQQPNERVVVQIPTSKDNQAKPSPVQRKNTPRDHTNNQVPTQQTQHSREHQQPTHQKGSQQNQPSREYQRQTPQKKQQHTEKLPSKPSSFVYAVALYAFKYSDPRVLSCEKGELLGVDLSRSPKDWYWCINCRNEVKVVYSFYS